MGSKNSTTLKSLFSLESLKVTELFPPPLLTKSLSFFRVSIPKGIPPINSLLWDFCEPEANTLPTSSKVSLYCIKIVIFTL